MNIKRVQTPNTINFELTSAKRRVLQLIVLSCFLLIGAHASTAATINVPADYPTIQAAVSASAPGDTIQVAAGTYTENLIINHRLILKGAGSGVDDSMNTIIVSAAANTPVITLTAGGDNATDRLVIQDLRIKGASGSSSHAGSGITLQIGVFGYLTFDNIAVVENSGHGIGINLFAPLNDIVILDSTLSQNGGSGFRAPASSTGINGLEVTNSHFDGNTDGGFTAYSFNLTNWNIKNSTFNDNVGPNVPYTGGYGMYIEGHIVQNINIDCSDFSRNIGMDENDLNVSAGLVFLPFTPGDMYSNITITHSKFDDNPLFGVLVQPGAGTLMENIALDCDAFERNGYGIFIFDPGVINGFSINHSNFVGNTIAGLENDNAATIDATKNWWGDPSGPSDSGPGAGDAIKNDWPGSGPVLFAPYRTTSSACPSACTPAPSINIVKKTNGTDNNVAPGLYLEVGSTVNWTYEVTNNGNVPLNNVTVMDNQGVIVTCPVANLADGESMTCTGSGAATAGQYTNIGTATGTLPTGQNVTASNPDNYFGLSPAISIVKLTNGTNNDTGTGPYVPVGSTVNWTYNVTNTGNVTLTNVAVTDNKIGAICTIGTLSPGAMASCTKSGTAVAGQYTNIGTATGKPPVGVNVTATNPDNYFGQAASISIVKKTNGTDNNVAPGPTVTVGSTVTWTYLVTNTGNVTLTGVAVTDNKVGAICTIGILAPGVTASCTKSGTAVAGQYTNIGTVTGKPPVGANVTASNPDNYFGQVSCPTAGTLTFSGNNVTSGTAGNIRTFSLNSLNVHASAFSRIRSSGTWNTAYIGAYTGGLGVTDTSEGNGSNNTHKTDNIGGRDNYVLLEFSEPVVVDRAFLDWVGADSDITVWIGTKMNPYTSHLTLSDALLSSLYTEVNATAGDTPVSRWADLNASQKSGNVVVIAAHTLDTSPEDAFKLSTLELLCPPPPVCAAGTFAFSSNTATSGTAGNIRTFTVNGVTVNVSAFSRADSGGGWATSYLGLYSGGLGVTDTSEGTGSNNTHKVDNLGGRNNYLLFEFSAPVVVDRAFLDIIGADSDLSAWIGTKTDPINNHLTLSDALLISLGSREDNAGSAAARWANINAGNVSGNVLVISAMVGDAAKNDAFKVSKLDVTCR